MSQFGADFTANNKGVEEYQRRTKATDKAEGAAKMTVAGQFDDDATEFGSPFQSEILRLDKAFTSSCGSFEERNAFSEERSASPKEIIAPPKASITSPRANIASSKGNSAMMGHLKRLFSIPGEHIQVLSHFQTITTGLSKVTEYMEMMDQVQVALGGKPMEEWMGWKDLNKASVAPIPLLEVAVKRTKQECEVFWEKTVPDLVDEMKRHKKSELKRHMASERS
ncbi:hypothetical protein QBC34DRAFT_492272 [Podospora aff. communis PSN243]|uniref:Uncharacterized protein n=1 Tax=Podospora aff. communis PSN243 TaxID=3040156 RepID=A0AAV9GUE4_9PEZI|nr:hypothetical protein QBC34DRAFT_492272 [Podospora aff. communis PSN243]